MIRAEELQQACWKGIPPAFRPRCWKLMAVYMPLKRELEERAIEQKRLAYWESVNAHYSSEYLDATLLIYLTILRDNFTIVSYLTYQLTYKLSINLPIVNFW